MVYRDRGSLSRIEKLACRWRCGDLFCASVASFALMAVPFIVFLIDNAQSDSEIGSSPLGADRLSNWVYLSALVWLPVFLAHRYKDSVAGRAMFYVDLYRSNSAYEAVLAWEKIPSSEPLRKPIMSEIARAHEDRDNDHLRAITSKVNKLVSTYAERRESELAVRRVNGVVSEIEARVIDLRHDISAFNDIAVQSATAKDTVQP